MDTDGSYRSLRDGFHLGLIPGSSCLATIIQSLRDKIRQVPGLFCHTVHGQKPPISDGPPGPGQSPLWGKQAHRVFFHAPAGRKSV